MSTVMRHKLREREESGNRIKVGIIGAGFFGCQAIGQVSRIPGITTSIIADIHKEKATRGFIRFAGRKPREIVEVNDAGTVDRYIEKNTPVITTDSQVLIESDVDVILAGELAPAIGPELMLIGIPFLAPPTISCV